MTNMRRILKLGNKTPTAVPGVDASAGSPLDFENVWDADAKKIAPGAADPAKWTTSAGATGPAPEMSSPNYSTTGSARAPQPGMASVAPEMAVPNGNPNVPKGGMSAEAQAWRSGGGSSPPTPPGGNGPAAAGGGVPPVPPEGPTPKTFAERVNARTDGLNARNAELARNLRNGVDTARNNVKAVGGNIAAVYNSPLAQGAMRLVAAADAVGQYGDFKKSAEEGDFASAADHALRGSSSALSISPTPLGLTAGALRGGMAVGDGINWGLDHSGQTGRDIKDSIGAGVNSIAKFFGGGVDDTALKLQNKYGGWDKVPPAEMAALQAHLKLRDGGGLQPNGQPLPAAPVAAPAKPTDWAAVNGASEAYNRAQGRDVGGNAIVPPTDTNAITKTVDANGNVTYSNNGNLRGGYQGGVVPAMDSELIERTLTNTDGTRWSSADNAIMAANIRDGIDPYRGTSQGRANDAKAAEPKLGDFGYFHHVANKQALRGQDITERDNIRNNSTSIRGQNMTAQTARSRLAWEEGWKQKEFKKGVDDTNFTQSQAADKSLTESISALAPVGTDGKPDSAFVANHKAGVLGYINDQITALKRIPKDSADYAQAQELAAQLHDKGHAALGADRVAQIVQQLEAKRRVAEAHSSGPLGGTFIDSANPADYDIVGEGSTAAGVPTYKLRGGSTVPKRSLDYVNGGNAVLPNSWGDNRTTRFDNLRIGK